MKKISYGVKVLILLFAILSLTGCSKGVVENADAAKAISSSGNIVTISNFTFKPKDLVIKSGTTVTWKQKDSAPHTVVSYKLFSSKTLSNGDDFKYKFTKKGKYNYICGIHPSMKGTIIVK